MPMLYLFFSFDTAASTLTTNEVTDLINEYKPSFAHFLINGLPFVSTFEGTDWTANWYTVRSANGNDYRESSYLNAPSSTQILSGADVYVDGFDLTTFRAVLPYFIAAFKTGSSYATLSTETAVAWYRTTSTADETQSAADGTSDMVTVIALANTPSDIIVSIGGSSTTGSPTKTVG
ncbi:hypothetical protein BX600DRAFT_509794 [Xylariales sp. PMI_506]|nr:hypothetical protein BX600DRAFT_509794 [Xylariales sp. PMI_506]